MDVQNKWKVGRKFLYSDELIKFYLMLMYYFRFDYRKTQALLLFMKEYLKKLKVPDYTILCVRQKALELFLENISRYKNKVLRITVDGTGLSMINKEDYIRFVHKKERIDKKTGFIRFVIGVDVDTMEIVGAEVTNDLEGENKKLKSILEQTIKNKDQPINTFFGMGLTINMKTLICLKIQVLNRLLILLKMRKGKLLLKIKIYLKIEGEILKEKYLLER